MDFLTQQFIASVKRLRAQLLTLENRIQSIQDQNERHHQQQQAQQSLPQPVLKVDAEIHEKPDPERDKKSGKKFNNGVQLALAIGTWLAFVAAGIYGYVAIRQWREMTAARHQGQQGINAAIRAANDADKSLAASDRALRIQERAWVGMSNVNTPQSVEEGVQFAAYSDVNNFGHSPATNVTQGAAMELRCRPFPKNPTYPDTEVSHETIMPGDHRATGVAGFPVPITSVQIAALKSGKCVLYFYGEIKYCDIFGESHYTHMCAHWLPGTKHAFMGCNVYNDSDSDYPDRPPEQCRR
jgi:hypothetical protein